MNYGVIYKITNKINNMSYIGQTTGNVYSRFSAHKRDTRKNRYITNVINKYGEENFLFEVVLVCFDQQYLNSMEDYFIKYFNTMAPNGYNLRPGGLQYGKMSEDTKLKISKSKSGIPNFKKRGEVRDENYRLKISRTLGGQNIIAINNATLEIKKYNTVNSTKLDGFNPSLVVAVCKNKRTHHKGYKFYYEYDYVNQSGSAETKESVHAQRIGIEPALAE